MGNVLVIHGGAPTAVINTSLYGLIKEFQKVHFCDKILAARFGSQGVLGEEFIDLTHVADSELEKLKYTPGSAIGTSRTPLTDADYARMIEIFKKHGIQHVLINGGNGSMNTCGNIWERVKGEGINVVGIPKTIDNDLMVTDHAPGFASCANYIGSTVKELAQDVKGLPIHVVVLEVMGRNTGWLAASSALARDKNSPSPHLICFPEVPFDQNSFLEKTERLYSQFGGVIIVASEGLKYQDGSYIVPPIFQVGQAVYFGDVSSHLSNLIVKNLGIKSRGEKPGILTRCAVPYVSKVDLAEAEMVGREAVRATLSGVGGIMIGIRRLSNVPYRAEPFHIPIKEVMQKEKLFSREFINPRGDDVTSEFFDWVRPLVNPSQKYTSFL